LFTSSSNDNSSFIEDPRSNNWLMPRKTTVESGGHSDDEESIRGLPLRNSETQLMHNSSIALCRPATLTPKVLLPVLRGNPF
jgi:hypothetical protein